MQAWRDQTTRTTKDDKSSMAISNTSNGHVSDFRQHTMPARLCEPDCAHCSTIRRAPGVLGRVAEWTSRLETEFLDRKQIGEGVWKYEKAAMPAALLRELSDYLGSGVCPVLLPTRGWHRANIGRQIGRLSQSRARQFGVILPTILGS